RPVDVRHCFASIEKISRELEFKPIINFEEGIKTLVEWARKEGPKEDMFEKADREWKERLRGE
ncbi:MAG: hypothetical protein ACE5KE_12635, partial [Methanosarcinales archaeon]